MAPPPKVEKQDAHPEALVQLLLEHGDSESALEVCRGWRLREPSNPRIDELEEEAATVSQSEETTLSFDPTEAERYLQKGYLHEAAFIYGKVISDPDFDGDPEVRERREKLSEFLHEELPDDAPPQVKEAEEQVRRRQLPMALLVYHELAQGDPDNEPVHHRRDLLRSLLVDMPSSVRVEEIGSLSDTITDSVEVDSSLGEKRKRRRLPARTVKSAPPEECIDALDPEPVEPKRRRRVRTQVDIPLQACFEAIEAAKEEEESASGDEFLRQDKDSTLPSPISPEERQIPVLEPLMAPSEEFSVSDLEEPSVEDEPSMMDEPPSIDEPPPTIDDTPPPSVEPPAIMPPPVVDEPLSADDGPPTSEQPSSVAPPPPVEEPPIIDDGPPPREEAPARVKVDSSSFMRETPSDTAKMEPAVIDDGPPPEGDEAPREEADEGDAPAPVESERDSWHEPAPVEPSHTSWLEPLIDDPPGRERAPEEMARDSWRVAADEPDQIDEDIDPFAPEWTNEGGRRRRRKRRGPRTLPSVSPMVVPQDESGRSVVEVPQEVPSVMERVSGHMSAREAAALAEPLGVIVREIHILEED